MENFEQQFQADFLCHAERCTMECLVKIDQKTIVTASINY